KRAYCLKTQPATGETYPKSDLFNKARWQLPVTLAFYLHSLDEPLLFSSRRFKQTADLGTSDQVAATAERKN
ncbi:hypothetical protein LVT07_24695, partial [Klebsiella pneumoniae]|nr:hypothetical protein [Klebsiella pneumoniae]